MKRLASDPALAAEGDLELICAVEARDAGREGVLATLRGVPILYAAARATLPMELPVLIGAALPVLMGLPLPAREEDGRAGGREVVVTASASATHAVAGAGAAVEAAGAARASAAGGALRPCPQRLSQSAACRRAC